MGLLKGVNIFIMRRKWRSINKHNRTNLVNRVDFSKNIFNELNGKRTFKISVCLVYIEQTIKYHCYVNDCLY